MTDQTHAPPPLAGRTALVTGAGSGFGRAISQRLARDGARLGLAELNAVAAEETRELIEADGGEAIVIPTDVTDYAAVEAAVHSVTTTWGRLDIMVNNAGITIREAFLDLTVDGFDKVMAANLNGVFHGVRAAGLQMKEQGGGVIINMSSIRANVGGFIHTSYCATKGGVRMLTKAAAVELGPHGVRVCAIGPGVAETPLTESLLASQEALDDQLARVPMGRLGQPEDISEVAAFLASDDAAYVTGATLYVDGGEMTH
ncbi:MAG: SDR family NAD(P)-dependent oxidoreductase [Chloroflexota bacterium]|nr:SDR family NAD(P)-dependent oxidoreductase [Chloroflexota bacterium]